MAKVGPTLLFPRLFHLVTFIIYAYSEWFNSTYVFIPSSRKTYGGRMKYLTQWNMILQTFYFGVCVLNDFLGSEEPPNGNPRKRSALQKFRDTVLGAMAVPMGSFVVVTFWGIYAVDRELVFPKVLDKIIPSWLNHVMHTTVLVFLLIEMYVVHHDYPRRKNGLAVCLGFGAIYQVWLFWIAFYANIWAYPILAVLAWPGRSAFIALCWVLLVGFYMLGEGLNKTLWGAPIKLTTKKLT